MSSQLSPVLVVQVLTRLGFSKHEARHTKPYRCTEAGCTRKDGFRTVNDLDRHTRSRHPRVNVSGHRSKCHRDKCLNKSKLWPRADNFRQHLKRIHGLDGVSEDDIEAYIYRYLPTSLSCPIGRCPS